MAVVATERLNVPLGMLRTIKAHALEMRGFEACGLIGGRDGYALQLARCGNRSDNPRETFFIDPWHQFCAEKSFGEAGFGVIGVYHSHPERDASPSEGDVLQTPSMYISVIYSLPDDECKAWRGATPVDIEVIRK